MPDKGVSAAGEDRDKTLVGVKSMERNALFGKVTAASSSHESAGGGGGWPGASCLVDRAPGRRRLLHLGKRPMGPLRPPQTPQPSLGMTRWEDLLSESVFGCHGTCLRRCTRKRLCSIRRHERVHTPVRSSPRVGVPAPTCASVRLAFSVRAPPRGTTVHVRCRARPPAPAPSTGCPAATRSPRATAAA